jgi:hypothetical protein
MATAAPPPPGIRSITSVISKMAKTVGIGLRLCMGNALSLVLKTASVGSLTRITGQGHQPFTKPLHCFFGDNLNFFN